MRRFSRASSRSSVPVSWPRSPGLTEIDLKRLVHRVQGPVRACGALPRGSVVHATNSRDRAKPTGSA